MDRDDNVRTRLGELRKQLRKVVGSLPGSSHDVEAHEVYVDFNDYAFYVIGVAEAVLSGTVSGVGKLHNDGALEERLQRLVARAEHPGAADATVYLRALREIHQLVSSTRDCAALMK